MKSKIANRIIAFTVCMSLFMGSLCVFNSETVYAANKKLTLSQAKDLAVANSSKMDQLDAKMSTKEASYKQAVQSISLKRKHLTTFSWSPLLSFHFPEQLTYTQQNEFTMKPVKLKGELDTVQHQMNDQKLEEYKKVQGYFVDIVMDQKKIDFANARIAKLQDTINRNKPRVLTKEASQSDIDKMESKVTALTNEVVTNSRDLEAKKKLLSKAIGMDVNSGYDFEDILVGSDIPRSALPTLKQATLDNDQAYYAACITAATNMTALTTNWNVIKKKYKQSDLNIIAPYITSAMNNETINSGAFTKAYQSFLKAIDRYWEGKKRIFLFIKIPRLWMKGDDDGVNYIEDEPNGLLEDALEYQDARLEKESIADELNAQVEAQYNTYISMRNAYQSFVKQVDAADKQLSKDAVLNTAGELSYDEYSSSLESYENLQQDMLSALADYSKTLYEFDRLTCGAVSQYLEGDNPNMFAVGGGVSYLEEEIAKGAYYYIKPMIQDIGFALTVSIPEDFDVQVTDYELYVNGTLVGEKNTVTDPLRHLGLVLDRVDEAKIRFYNGDNAVCDCVIDSQAYSGPLDIISGYNTRTDGDKVLCSYKTENSSTGIMKLTLSVSDGSDIAHFRLRYNGDKYVGGEDLLDATKPFKFLPLMGASLDKITVEFFDKDGAKLKEGYFDTNGGKIKELPDAMSDSSAE